ncbi:hypothetical protein QYF36_022103 [Acer negundo]|nr:hypothetical protein QYF36_022103 [Acer negundo]
MIIRVGSIPAGIGNATKLTFLYLGSNNLTNSINPEIGNLSELQVLRLYNNSLTGQIPYQLSNPQKVWLLRIGANNLEDPDRNQFKGMSSLTYLWLDYNLLENVSSFVAECPKLKFLDLSGLEIGNMERLEELDLSLNELQGTLPGFVSKQSKWDHTRRPWGLPGPLPNGRAFQQAPAEAVAGNPDTCSETAQGISPCS